MVFCLRGRRSVLRKCFLGGIGSGGRGFLYSVQMERRLWVSEGGGAPYSRQYRRFGYGQLVVNAFISVEDARFLEHDGVDWKRTVAVTVSKLRDVKGKSRNNNADRYYNYQQHCGDRSAYYTDAFSYYLQRSDLFRLQNGQRLY